MLARFLSIDATPLNAYLFGALTTVCSRIQMAEKVAEDVSPHRFATTCGC